jgi:signal recognition particle receptor subunit beta
MIFFTWIALSFVVGFVGSSRKIGFGGAFIAALLLSPIVGYIIAFQSKDVEDEKYKESILDTQKRQEEALSKINKGDSLADQLEKLMSMKERKLLSDEEFDLAKKKLLNN